VEETKRVRDHPVGFCRPPLLTRFPEGRSGNPRGRPRASKVVAIIVNEVLSARVAVRENGRVGTMTKREALITQAVNKAVAGDLRALKFLFTKFSLMQRDLIGLRKRPKLREEATDATRRLVRGALDPQLDGGSLGESGGARRGPDIWEVTTPLERTLKNRR
jgi:Family of unknown function (DUF5681)